MNVARATLDTIMTELGFKNAENMDTDKLLGKLKLALPKVDEETVEAVDDEEAKDLLEKLIELPSLLAKLEVDDEVAEDDEEAGDEEESEEESEDEESEDEEEDEDEEDEDEKPRGKKKTVAKKTVKKASKKEKSAPTAKKTVKKASKKEKSAPTAKKKTSRGTGVIANIVAALKEASKAKPVSKDVILKKLAKAFPDRAEDSMRNTINAQLGYHLQVNKGLKVMHNDDGYYLGK